jgi:hypothetical protein
MRAYLLPALALSLTLPACVCEERSTDPVIGAAGFTDDFERTELGSAWNNTGANQDGTWRIENGALTVRDAHNHPLWLARVLPRDVRIEYEVRSMSPEGDIKCEVFGDGRSAAIEASYTATSYVVIFGGWGNQLDVLARLNEHGEDRVEHPTRRVIPGQTYRMRVERRGQVITAWVDDQEFLTMTDPDPLEGAGHDHFAFNDWESELVIDNVRITPL